jgi:hypothetical protein
MGASFVIAEGKHWDAGRDAAVVLNHDNLSPWEKNV